MKRRVVAKRRSKHRKAENAVNKIQISLMKRGVKLNDTLDRPEVRKAWARFERSIDQLPPHKLLHKWLLDERGKKYW